MLLTLAALSLALLAELLSLMLVSGWKRSVKKEDSKIEVGIETEIFS
jgi:hypothetical protein